MGLRDIFKAILFQFAGATRLFFILLSFHLAIFLTYYIFKDSLKSTYNEATLEISNTTLDPYYNEIEFLLESIKEAKNYDSLIMRLPFQDMIEFSVVPEPNPRERVDTYKQITQLRSNDLSEIKRYFSNKNLIKIASKLNKQNEYKEKYKEMIGIRDVSAPEFNYNDKIVFSLSYENVDQLNTHMTSLMTHVLNNFSDDLLKFINIKTKIFLNDNNHINELIEISSEYRDVKNNKDFEFATKMLKKTKDNVLSLDFDSIQNITKNILDNLNIKISAEKDYLPGTIEVFIILLFSQFLFFSIFNFLIRYYNENKII